jgi:hypothetical protein
LDFRDSSQNAIKIIAATAGFMPGIWRNCSEKVTRAYEKSMKKPASGGF